MDFFLAGHSQTGAIYFNGSAKKISLTGRIATMDTIVPTAVKGPLCPLYEPNTSTHHGFHAAIPRPTTSAHPSHVLRAAIRKNPLSPRQREHLIPRPSKSRLLAWTFPSSTPEPFIDHASLRNQ